jgi:hypothetical protein
MQRKACFQILERNVKEDMLLIFHIWFKRCLLERGSQAEMVPNCTPKISNVGLPHPHGIADLVVEVGAQVVRHIRAHLFECGGNIKSCIAPQ